MCSLRIRNAKAETGPSAVTKTRMMTVTRDADGESGTCLMGSIGDRTICMRFTA